MTEVEACLEVEKLAKAHIAPVPAQEDWGVGNYYDRNPSHPGFANRHEYCLAMDTARLDPRGPSPHEHKARHAKTVR